MKKTTKSQVANKQKAKEANEELTKKSYAEKHKKLSDQDAKDFLALFHQGTTKQDIAFLGERQIKSISRFIDAEVRKHLYLEEKEWDKLDDLLGFFWKLTMLDEDMTIKDFLTGYGDQLHMKLHTKDIKEEWPTSSPGVSR